MKMTVPLTGTSVTPQGEGPQANGATPTPAPAETQQQPARQSLHQVRMPRQEVAEPEIKYVWDKFGRAKAVPVEAAQAEAPQETGETADVEEVEAGEGSFDVPPLTGSQHATAGESARLDAMERQVATMAQALNNFVQNQLGAQQPAPPPKPQAPEPPDPSQFDLYDPEQLAQFTRLNNAYLKAEVSHQVNAALEPHGATLQDARWTADYNRLRAQHGNDPNFAAKADAALRLVAKFPNISIPAAFDAVGDLPISSPQQQKAAPSPSAKPARTITTQEAALKAEQAKRLPASNGVSGTGQPALPSNIRTLGQIMLWNRQNGRAN